MSDQEAHARAGADLRIRAATRRDLAALAALEADAFSEPAAPWSRALLDAELRQPSSRVWIAFDLRGDGSEDGEPAGYAAFRAVAGEAELLRMATRRGARRRGVGRRLLEHGLDRLREGGIASCFLEVRPENRPALGLYESLGFEPAGRRPKYFADGADALVLRRELARGALS